MKCFERSSVTFRVWNHYSVLVALRTLAAAIVLAVWSAPTVGLHADEIDGQPWWPCFHGPNRDNVSRETGLMKEWPEEGPELLWKFTDCGEGFSGVSLADGKIFTAGDFGDVEKAFALDMDGRLLWQTPNGESWTGPYPGSRTTPAFDDGMLYQRGPKGRLAAFRAATGEEVWGVDLVKEFVARYGTWSMTENVAVEGDLVFCIPGGSKALVVVLNKKTGQTVWTNKALDETAAYCSPILVDHGGIRQLIAMTRPASWPSSRGTLRKRPFRNAASRNRTGLCPTQRTQARSRLPAIVADPQPEVGGFSWASLFAVWSDLC